MSEYLRRVCLATLPMLQRDVRVCNRKESISIEDQFQSLVEVRDLKRGLTMIQESIHIQAHFLFVLSRFTECITVMLKHYCQGGVHNVGLSQDRRDKV